MTLVSASIAPTLPSTATTSTPYYYHHHHHHHEANGANPAADDDDFFINAALLPRISSQLRIMSFICIFTVLFTAFVLFLNISHLGSLLPIEVGKVVSYFYIHSLGYVPMTVWSLVSNNALCFLRIANRRLFRAHRRLLDRVVLPAAIASNHRQRHRGKSGRKNSQRRR